MKKHISPSLICMDLCDLKNETNSLSRLGIRMLHIDIIDGIFSPDMPLGIDTVRQLRAYTELTFDVHLMSVRNAPYVDLLLDCGIDRLCFHTEFEPRPTILLRKIKAANVRAGIAISPETPLGSVIHLLPLCDFVLVMRIDAGYAHLKGQAVYPHINEKIRALRAFSAENGLDLEIEVDGRVGFDCMDELCACGADTFVSGSAGLFYRGDSRERNAERLRRILEKYP